MTLGELRDRLRVLLQDLGTHKRWSDDQLRDCLNEARAAVVMARPDSLSKEVTYSCTASARQLLPAAVHRLLDVIENTDSGRMVTVTTRATMDANLPNWRTETGPDAENYIYDEANPHRFYVYPTPPADHELTLLVNPVVEPLADGDAMDMTGVWLNPVLLYAASRAFDMDAEVPASNQLAGQFRQRFANELGLKWKTDISYSPSRDKGELVSGQPQ